MNSQQRKGAIAVTVTEFINKIGFKVKQDDVKKVNDTISGIKSTATKLLGAIGIGLSLTNLNAIAEEFNGINDKINFAVKGLADQKEAQKAILKAANDTKSTYAAMAGTVTNLVKAGSDLFSVDEAVEFSSAVTKLLKTAGRGEGEIQSVMNGLNKSFQKGTVESETLKVMLEQCPEAANLLADKLGVAKTQLLDMATNGKISCQQLKNAFLSSTTEIDAAFGDLDYSVSDALLNIRNRFGFYIDELNTSLGVTKTIAKTMVSGFNQVMGVLNKVRNGVVWLSEKLGGAEKLMKLVALAAGAILIAMNFTKITSGLSSILKLISGIKLGTVALVGAIILAALLVEDFINFMQGNDSLLGAMLQKAGVDCDALREKIRNTWDNIKKVFQSVAEAIKGVIGSLFASISKLWGAYGGEITNKISNVIANIVDKLNALSEWLVKHKDTVIKFDMVIRGLAIAFLAINKGIQVFYGEGNVIEKVGPAFNAIKGIVGKAGSAFKLLASPVGIAVVAIAAVLAIAYDFFNFMKGKDSVIGKIFEKMGVDCDAVRQKVMEIWGKVKDFLLSVWNTIKSVGEEIWGGLKAFWDKHGEQIKRSFENIWTGIKKTIIAVWDVISVALKVVWGIIKTVAEVVFNRLKVFWDTWGETIIATFKGIWNIIKTVFSAVFDVLADIFAVFSDIFAGDWSQLWEDVKQLFSDIWNGIVSILTTVFDTILNVLSSIFDAIGNILSNIWTGVKETVGNIKDCIVEGFSAAVDWIKGLPSQALEWGKDIVTGIADGIKGAAEAVGDAVKGVADKIKSFLGFSEPEDGPLSNFHTYMPDMIDLMAKGINAGKSKISEAVSALAGDMSIGIQANADDIALLANSGKVSDLTLSAAGGQSNVNKNVVQNIEINNEFNGDRTGQRESANAMDKASSDCTAELARAMAYAR